MPSPREEAFFQSLSRYCHRTLFSEMAIFLSVTLEIKFPLGYRVLHREKMNFLLPVTLASVVIAPPICLDEKCSEFFWLVTWGKI